MGLLGATNDWLERVGRPPGDITRMIAPTPTLSRPAEDEHGQGSSVPPAIRPMSSERLRRAGRGPGPRLGLAWRSPTWLPDHDAGARVDLGLTFDQPDPITFPDGFVANCRGRLRSLGTPQSLAAGISWQATSCLLMTVEGRWTQWSATHRSLDLSLDGGDNAGVNAFVGSDRLMIHVPLDWRGQWSVGAGADLALGAGWTLRAGGTGASDPVPNGGASPGSPAFARWHLGLGLGWRAEHVAVDLGWLHTFKATETVATSRVSSDLDGSTQSIAPDSLMLTVSFRF